MRTGKSQQVVTSTDTRRRSIVATLESLVMNEPVSQPSAKMIDTTLKLFEPSFWLGGIDRAL